MYKKSLHSLFSKLERVQQKLDALFLILSILASDECSLNLELLKKLEL